MNPVSLLMVSRSDVNLVDTWWLEINPVPIQSKMSFN